VRESISREREMFEMRAHAMQGEMAGEREIFVCALHRPWCGDEKKGPRLMRVACEKREVERKRCVPLCISMTDAKRKKLNACI